MVENLLSGNHFHGLKNVFIDVSDHAVHIKKANIWLNWFVCEYSILPKKVTVKFSYESIYASNHLMMVYVYHYTTNPTSMAEHAQRTNSAECQNRFGSW